MDGLKDLILVLVSVLSLIVSITTVILGHKRSIKIAQMQIESSAKLTNKQILSPIRQVWIENLRQKISEFLGLSDRFYRFLHDNDNEIIKFYERHKLEFVSPDVEKRLELLHIDITLMLNDNEEDHKKLINLLRDCRINAFDEDSTVDEYVETHKETVRLCKSILKGEWERVKNEE